MNNSTTVPLQLQGKLSQRTTDLLADLIAASTSGDCEICCKRPKQQLIEQGEYEGRYVCSRCFRKYGDSTNG